MSAAMIGSSLPPLAALPAHRWHPCGSLPARPRHRPLPLHGPMIFIPISSIEVMTASTASRRWSPPSLAIMTSSRTCSALGLPYQLFRQAVTAPLNRPKTSPSWPSLAIKDMEDEHAANRLQHRCEECGIPSILIVPDRSDLNDDLIAFGERNPRGPDRAPYCQHQVRGNGGREAWKWENNYPVVMSHCPTRSHCANPCGVLHSAYAPLRR